MFVLILRQMNADASQYNRAEQTGREVDPDGLVAEAPPLDLNMTLSITLRRETRHGGQHHRESEANRAESNRRSRGDRGPRRERVPEAVDQLAGTARRASETASRSSEEL